MAFLVTRGNNAIAKQMNFIDHLEDLRWHIIKSAIAILIAAAVVFVYRNWVFDYIITGPINPDFVTYSALCRFGHWLHMGDALCMPPVKIDMQSTTFAGQFLSSISMAVEGGLLIAFPYVFWQLWQFVKPALTLKELKGTRFVIFWVSFFFFCGAAFGFFLLGPFTFNFLGGFQLGVKGTLLTRPTLADYLDNLTNIILGCSIAFELPVIAYILTRIGIITPIYLRKTRKYAVIILLLAAAIITPSPDFMSQMIVFIPLWILFELSILISARVTKQMALDIDEK